MSYLNDVFYTDVSNRQLYKLTNDAIDTTVYPVSMTGSEPTTVLVASDMVTVAVLNEKSSSVSLYKNGSLIVTRTVGGTPTGICEDPNGNFYITCKSASKVYKVSPTGTVLATIVVGKYPMGICCSNDGTVYVANYSSATVSKIVDDQVTANIKVTNTPTGICVDKNDIVWVTHDSNNAISKITKTGDVTKIPLTNARPYGICLDKNGDKWIAGFASGIAYRMVGDTVKYRIAVGSSPKGIASNSNGDIYVFNSGDRTISKITSNIVVATIKTSNTNGTGLVNSLNNAFGDATGYQFYYVHKYNPNAGTGGGTGGGGASLTTGSVIEDYLEDSLKTKINNAAQLPIADKDVTHDLLSAEFVRKEDITTVKKALDYLLYEDPAITSFKNNVNTVEIGSSVSSVILTWVLNKTMSSLTIDNGIGDVTGKTTITDTTALNTTVAGTKTYKLTASDGNKTVTATTSVSVQNRMFYGAATVVPGATGISSLESSKLATSKAISADFDCSGGKYIVFAMPTSFGLTVNNFKVNGLANNAWTKTEVTFTNTYGVSIPYTIFSSNNKLNGSKVSVAIA